MPFPMPAIRRWLPVATLLLTAARAPAQDFFARTQEEDGHWSAAAHGGVATADLRVTAMMMLALLGDGSTARGGPKKVLVKSGMLWLHRARDAQGRLALRADPDWVLDHAMATYVLVENLRLGEFTALAYLDPCIACSDTLSRELALRQPPPSVEVSLWSELVVRSLLTTAVRLEANEDHAAKAPRVRQTAERLSLAVKKVRNEPSEVPREQAAAALLADLRGEAVAAPAMPESLLDDPLRTFYVTALLFRRGGADWKAAQKLLEQRVVKTQIRDRRNEANDGSWDPVGAFGEQNGRLGTTAAAVLLLEIYYRYCRLGVFTD